MYMVSVSSRNLQAVGYDEQSKILRIEFVNGKVYEYYDVSKNIYIGLITASSVNDYFVEYVRDVYRYSQI